MTGNDNNGGNGISPVPGTGGMVVRVPPAVGEALLAARVEELINALELAFGVPPEPGKEHEPPIDAVMAVARFARSVGCSWDAVWGLTDLAYDLQDLRAGRAVARFRPKKPEENPGGNPGDSSVTWSKRVNVVIAMRALRGSGLHESEAAQHIAQKYPDLEGLMTRGKNLPGTIQNWRSELVKAERGEFLWQFSRQMSDLEKDLNEFVAQQSPSPDRLRQFAYNILARARS
jgi:hypothetical protein